MAKSVEDTAFYRYNRLIALNEVGCDPRQFGNSSAAFHAQNRDRAQFWPANLLATSTHDTKRGEDARARLLALPDIASVWRRQTSAWAKLNARHKTMVADRPAPDRNDEYLIYQMLIGAWPVDLDQSLSASGLADFAARVRTAMIKAMREAKQNTSWDNPNEEYETAVCGFIDRLLDGKFGRIFLSKFQPFGQHVARLGVLNSLIQVTLKLCLPGVPDFYQGSELWNFSFVDPDNRHPVDYRARIQAFASLADTPPAMDHLRKQWHDGRVKLAVVMKLLEMRRRASTLFERGNYEPIDVQGTLADKIIAFRRCYEDQEIIVAVSRNIGNSYAEGRDLAVEVWEDASLRVGPGSWRDVMRNADHHIASDHVHIGDLCPDLPVVVLERLRQSPVGISY